jgi:replicative DNA helicase
LIDNIEAEKELLKCIIFDYLSCEKAFETLKPEYFNSTKHQQIFEKMSKLAEIGTDINIITLTEASDINTDYIMDLSSDAFSAVQMSSYLDIVVNQYFKREGHKRLIEAAEHAKNSEATPDSLRELTEDAAYFLSHRSEYKGLQSLTVVAEETIKQLERISESGEGGVKTGFKDLDRLGYTFRPKTLNIIGARPAMGKSALALDIAEKCEVPVAFFSLEMEGIEQVERMISKRLGLTNTKLRSKEVILENTDKIADTAHDVSKMKIWINDSPSVSPIQIRMQCKRMQAKHGLGLVIIDYMGYIRDKQRHENRRIEMGHFSRSLKELAKDLNVPIVCLCQLNRSCEDRSDKRPLLADLRETGDIEQDAHMVWFLYRESVYEENSNPESAEVLIRKNRGGKIGSVRLTFKKEITSFKDYYQSATFDKNDWVK